MWDYFFCEICDYSRKSCIFANKKRLKTYELPDNMNGKELSIINESEYQQWLQYLCDEIDRQRLKAVMQMNAATLQHYWWLGNVII